MGLEQLELTGSVQSGGSYRVSGVYEIDQHFTGQIIVNGQQL